MSKSIITEYSNKDFDCFNRREGHWNHSKTTTIRRRYFGDDHEFLEELQSVIYMDVDKILHKNCLWRHAYKHVLKEMSHNIKFVKAKLLLEVNFTPSEKEMIKNAL